MKTALVCEGGGTKAAYTAGVLACLFDQGVSFDYHVGVSSGALAMINFVVGDLEMNHQIFTQVLSDPRAIGWYPLCAEGQIYGTNFIDQEIERLGGLQLAKLAQVESVCEVVVCNYSKRRNEYFRNQEITSPIVKAANSLLMLTRRVFFRGNYYTDGGLLEMIPLRRGASLGVEKFLIISTKEENFVRKPIPWYQYLWAPLFYRDFFGYQAMKQRHQVYQEELQMVAEWSTQGKALFLRPSEDLQMRRSSNDPNQLEALYRMGYQDTLARIEEIKTFLQGSG